MCQIGDFSFFFHFGRRKNQFFRNRDDRSTLEGGVHELYQIGNSQSLQDVHRRKQIYTVWMQETTQRIIKLLGLLLPDLLVKKC